MKYKVGDRLLIKKGLNRGERYGVITFQSSMDIGTITVKEINYHTVASNTYFAAENGYWYSEEMIERRVDMFTKDDLKTGMVVEFTNGELALVMRDTKDIEDAFYIYNKGKDNYSVALKFYDDDMRDTSRDVVRVYSTVWGSGVVESIQNEKISAKMHMVWQREETQEMTLAQVCKELGRTIKIVKD